jgi:hypothetical protein
MGKSETEVLVNANVNAVVFVMDYLQLQLDIGIVTYMAFPEVSSSEEVYRFGERDYRNELCKFIGERVSSIEVKEDELFCLNFKRGKISISLSPEKYTCPEMVVIDLADKGIVF